MKKKIIVPVSFGELIDKITILEIKQAKIKDAGKKKLIIKELNSLTKQLDKIKKNDGYLFVQLKMLKDRLSLINKKLWNIEDRIRKHEREKDFGADFIMLARKVYLNNDKRFTIKNKIDKLLNSEIQEVKHYKEFTA
jgi:hypothetical protein